jgi:hypothetical protein
MYTKNIPSKKNVHYHYEQTKKDNITHFLIPKLIAFLR